MNPGRDRMKKVLFVATVVKIHINLFHTPYLKWFKENGYEVHVCAKNDYEHKEDCVIPHCDRFYDLPFERSPAKSGNVKAYRELKQIVDANDYDIIHCHTPVGSVAARWAAREARKKGTRVLYTAHGFHFYKGAPLVNWLLYYPVEKWFSRYTDTLITINKEDYHRALTFDAGKVEYVPGVGLNTKDIQQTRIDKAQKKKELGVPESAFTLLSIGEHNKNKNHEVVLRALAKLNDDRMHYIICGQGALQDDLQELTRELGLDAQVHFAGYRKDIKEVCRTADVFVFPSYREGLSVALMEAMASGLPVICSNIRGNSDLVEDGKGGYLVSPGETDQFAESIQKMQANPDLRKQFGEYNVERIEEFSIEKVSRRMEDIYRNVSVSENPVPAVTKPKL